MPGNLRLGFWNIFGYRSSILGNKLHQREVRSIFEKHDFFGIVETHAENKTEGLEVNNFKCYKKCRQRSGKKGHGGIAVYFRTELKQGISYIPTNNENAIWCKLDKTYFDLQSDIYLATIYLSPEKYEKQKNKNYIEQLENEIVKFSELGDIMLQGDLNARCGHLQDQLFTGKDNFIDQALTAPGHVDIPPRNSEDEKAEGRGKELIESCISNGLAIINGRKLGDRKGQKTCFQYNGSSLIDYVICSNNIFKDINYLKPADLLPHLSNHCHVSYGLKIRPIAKNLPKTKAKLLEEKCVWTADAEYKVSQITQSQKFTTILDTFCKINLRDDSVDSCVETLNHMINDVLRCANVLKPIKSTEGDIEQKNPNKDFEWFDQECKTEKENLACIGRQACKFPHNKDILSLLACKKRSFRKTTRMKKRSFEKQQIKSLQELLKDKNPKQFWIQLKNIFKKSKTKKHKNIVTTDEFYSHFCNLQATNETTPNTQHCAAENAEEGPLDYNFTEKELDDILKRLKRNKSPGPDNILNEFLKTTKNTLLPTLTKLFNKILENGDFPKEWAHGYIIPIHKKGEKDNPENYRGITLLSCLGKVFTSALNKRLLTYAEANNILQPEQAGFRENFRTSDNIFVLKTLLDKYVRGRPKKKENFLFTCFVDLRKAFDKIDRNKLFTKLSEKGIVGKFLSVIKSIYSKDKSCVRNGNEVSESFNCKVGIKQGCILSPTLFNIYMHDFPKSLNETADKDVPRLDQDCPVNSLLYADDIILTSTSANGLQLKLDLLNHYCQVNNLEVSKEKTKVMIFNSNGRKLTRFKFHISGDDIEIVTAYKYLGLTLSTNGLFNLAKTELKKAALRALFSLKSSLGVNFNLDVKLTTQLFEIYIKPILLYCSEIWGLDGKFNEMRDPIEQVHSKFCKILLGVSKNAVNKACRAELGRYLLQNDVIKANLAYWFRIIKLEQSRLTKLAYHESRKQKKSWAQNIKHTLFSCGFGWTWENQNSLDPAQSKQLIKKIHNRYKDMETQTFFAYIFNDERENKTSKNKLRTYRLVKSNYSLEQYLTSTENIKHRTYLTKLRISDHELEIERGRYKRPYVEANQRYCPFCPGEVEDEKHFLIKCPLYNKFRQNLSYKLNKEFQFMELINPPKNSCALIAKFICDCFNKRKNEMTSTQC